MQVLGLNSGHDSQSVLEAFVRAFQIDFPILVNASQTGNDYSQIPSGSPYPLDYVIDQQGKVAFFATEYRPERMIEVIDGLLGYEPAIDTDADALNFSAVGVGQSASLLLEVQNGGTGTLQVTAIATDTGEYEVNLESLLVPAGAIRSLHVTFSPLFAGARPDTLWLASNDPVRPLLAIPLQGIGGDGVGVGDFGPGSRARLTSDPNPFRGSTEIRFSLPATGSVWLEVFDIRGRLVRTLAAGDALSAGDQARVWDGRDDSGQALSSGIYFSRLRADGKSLTRKITLLR